MIFGRVLFKKAKKRHVFIFGEDGRRFLRDQFQESDYYYYNTKNPAFWLNFEVLLWFLVYWFRIGSIKSAYLVSLVRVFAEDVFITLADNSIHTFRIAKHMKKHIRVIAIQNGNRWDVANHSKTWQSEICIPEYIVFGQHEVNMFTDLNAEISHYYKVGSLMEMRYRETLKEKCLSYVPGDRKSFKYDICLLSENFCGFDRVTPGIEDTVGTIAKFVQRYAEKHSLKVCMALKSRKHPEAEYEFYKKYIDIEQMVIGDRTDNDWSSYEFTNISWITVGMVSTLLLETASRHNRIMICDYFGKPWSNTVPSPVSSKNPELDYEVFERHMNDAFFSSDEDYWSKRKDIVRHYIEDPKDRTVRDTLQNVLYKKTQESAS